jgi:hypothetical protein
MGAHSDEDDSDGNPPHGELPQAQPQEATQPEIGEGSRTPLEHVRRDKGKIPATDADDDDEEEEDDIKFIRRKMKGFGMEMKELKGVVSGMANVMTEAFDTMNINLATILSHLESQDALFQDLRDHIYPPSDSSTEPES